MKQAKNTILCIILSSFLAACNGGGEGTADINTDPGNNTPSATSIALSWRAPEFNFDGSELKDLAGYKVYYGTTSGVYTHIIDVGTSTAFSTPTLAVSKTYFFAVAAYDQNGNESELSIETSKSI